MKEKKIETEDIISIGIIIGYFIFVIASFMLYGNEIERMLIILIFSLFFLIYGLYFNYYASVIIITIISMFLIYFYYFYLVRVKNE